MLTIRMQRTGRKGYASFRIVVQDSRFSPSSGRVVAKIGHYNPHTKETVIEKEKAVEYLQNGAQPSPRVVRLFQAEKIVLPDWVVVGTNESKRTTRNPEKLRKNQPKEEIVEETPAEETVVETEAEAVEAETPAEEIVAEQEPAVEETPAEV
jgi:small subunit ribosomal protein S16